MTIYGHYFNLTLPFLSCYTKNMQPDQQDSSQPQLDKREPEDITGVYTPSPIIDKVNTIIDNSKKPVIENPPIHWSAHEYIYKEKSGLWFVMFVVVILIFIVLDVFLLKSYTFSVLVIVMAVAVIVYSRRPPRVIDYTLSGDHGLYIGEKLYHFSEFRAFGLIREDGNNSIMLIPIKRFSPGVSVYFPQEVGEQVVDIFGARLPMETIKFDIIDVIVQKLRL